MSSWPCQQLIIVLFFPLFGQLGSMIQNLVVSCYFSEYYWSWPSSPVFNDIYSFTSVIAFKSWLSIFKFDYFSYSFWLVVILPDTTLLPISLVQISFPRFQLLTLIFVFFCFLIEIFYVVKFIHFFPLWFIFLFICLI